MSGLGRRGNYERTEKLNKQAKEILGQLIVLAARQPRNYIIDQVGIFYILSTCRPWCYHGNFPSQDNVYNTTRRAKMALFEGFKKKACVCIVSAEERRRRERRREDMSEVPLHVLRNMQGEYHMECHVTCFSQCEALNQADVGG